MRILIKNKKIKVLLVILILVVVGIISNNNFTLAGEKNNNYNRELAREYAIKWAISSNKQYYNYINDGGDCTNFVSQVLRAGGMDFIGSRKNATSIDSWFYYSSDLPNRTSTWTSANAFNLHFGKSGKRVYKYRKYSIEEALKNWDEIYSSIYIGDIIQYTRPNNIAFHSQAITDLLDNKTIYFSQHSNTIENFYKNGNLKYYLLGKPNDYNLLIYNIKEEKSVNNNMRNKPITTEKNYNKELKEALKIIKLSIEDTRFDNKGYRNIETEEFINKMEKKLTEVELQMDKRSKKSKELLEILLDRSNI
ncbi:MULTISPECIES: amidase domain-containing protein [unclassified Clostridium]|uniref:amidase domain-containing protein n=1 Tax=unclassified Clostridium TaxID=2614128 RepID=UPI0025F399D1|nr:amidase domain-containing protein [Clostridium sp.]MDY4251395.1 amidase domain-containing protein [Clostridium sp.]